MQKKVKKNVPVYMPENEHARFKLACSSNDTTMAAQLLLMAKQYSDKEEKKAK